MTILPIEQRNTITKASIRLWSSFFSARLSQPYVAMGHTRALSSLCLVGVDTSLWLPCGPETAYMARLPIGSGGSRPGRGGGGTAPTFCSSPPVFPPTTYYCDGRHNVHLALAPPPRFFWLEPPLPIGGRFLMSTVRYTHLIPAMNTYYKFK